MKFAGALLLASTALPHAALAQQQGSGFSQLDVRPPTAVQDLNRYLARLGSNPRDVGALIGAGEAALDLDDPRAATGFFARADEIQKGNGRIKAGLGRAMLKMQNAPEALRLFDQAVRLGQPDRAFVSDRGLARDLTGDPAGAQRDYQAALRVNPNHAETLRRYAVSLGISGQVDQAEQVIQPLLYQNDRAAWRNRAFVLAMNGRQEQARDITQKVMPKRLADAIRPYMERMPALTAAQRAAAVHFGNFPTNVRAAATPPAAALAQAPSAPPSAPVAASRQLSNAQAQRPARASRRQQRASARRQQQTASQGARIPIQVAAPATQSSPQPPQQAPQPDSRRIGDRLDSRVARRVADTPTQIAAAEAARTAQQAQQRRQAQQTTRPVQQAPAQQGAPRALGPQVQGPPAPGPSAAPISQPVQQVPAATPQSRVPAATAQVQGPPAPQPAVARFGPAPAASGQVTAVASAPPAPDPVATRTLADIIRELEVPEAERRVTVAAVDLTEVASLQEQRRKAQQAAAEKLRRDAAAKAKAQADAKAKAEAAEKARLAKNPSRNWVQIATGQDVGALGFTLRSLRKKEASLALRDAWTAPWGRTRRLVVGPFPSFAKARDYEADLRKAGLDVFAWQSGAGEEVSPLGTR